MAIAIAHTMAIAIAMAISITVADPCWLATKPVRALQPNMLAMAIATAMVAMATTMTIATLIHLYIYDVPNLLEAMVIVPA